MSVREGGKSHDEAHRQVVGAQIVDHGGGHIGNWRAKTRAFVDGLRLAASRGEDVEFH